MTLQIHVCIYSLVRLMPHKHQKQRGNSLVLSYQLYIQRCKEHYNITFKYKYKFSYLIQFFLKYKIKIIEIRKLSKQRHILEIMLPSYVRTDNKLHLFRQISLSIPLIIKCKYTTAFLCLSSLLFTCKDYKAETS